jgi:hypothetical protein
VKKTFIVLFAALSIFSQIWAQSSNNVTTQTISDILSCEEPSLQEHKENTPAFGKHGWEGCQNVDATD